MLETFVDQGLYKGTCYRAANWLYAGETGGYGKVGITYQYHGKQKRKFFYGKTRQEVAEKLNHAVHTIQQGTFVNSNKIRTEEWLEEWLYTYKKSSVRPSTFMDYEYLIRVHINPIVGKLLIKDLRPEHLQRLYNEKSACGQINGSGGLSPSSVRHIHIVLHQALRQAVRNNLIPRDVSESLELPQVKKATVKVFTVEAQMKFLGILAKERLRAAFITAFGTGVREGELLALRWQDVDLIAGIIHIEQTVRRCRINFENDRAAKTKLIFGSPKTDAGKRSIPLPEGVHIELIAHKKRQIVEKLAAGEIWEMSGLVFTTELGKVIEPRNFLRKYYQLLKDADLEHLKFHAASRHTFATRLLEANEHPKVVQELLGHASIVLTLDTYSHVLPEIKQAAAAKLNFLFQEKKSSIKEGL